MHETGPPKMLLHLECSSIPRSTDAHLDGECRNMGTKCVPRNKASAGDV